MFHHKKSMQSTDKGNSYGLPFSLARFFSWVSLVLVLAFSVFLSLFIGNNTTVTLIDSQKEYALLLAENLNKQIFRRFTLPVTYASGRVALGDPVQYKLLDDLVQTLVHGLRIDSIRIYDSNYVVTYSTDPNEVLKSDHYTSGVPLVFQGTPYHFDVLSSMGYIFALFRPHLPDRTFQLRTVYPLSIDKDFEQFDKAREQAPVLGALEITQDVTSHYQIAIRSQWLIMAGFAASSLILFILLQIMARQAERILGERMARNRQLEAELHQNEKLASMGRMVASIAHEIRNPLGIIRSSSEFLLRRHRSEDATSQHILEAIFDESCRLGTTVNDFLDYAKPRQPQLLRVDLGEVLQKAANFLRGEFDRQQIAMFHSLPSGLAIYGDPDSLYRAFYNILVNAQQAMSDGPGSITVQGGIQADGMVHIVFTDTGPGFQGDDLQKPLDPFYTTKDMGTGLGLSIVMSIVRSHGGTLALDNAPDGGAMVSLLFPKDLRTMKED